MDFITGALLIEYGLGFYFIFESVGLSFGNDGNGKRVMQSSVDWFGLVLGGGLLGLAIFSKVLRIA